jgi:hypothetical protein
MRDRFNHVQIYLATQKVANILFASIEVSFYLSNMKAEKTEKRRFKNLKIDADVHMSLSVYCSWTRSTMSEVGSAAIKKALPKLPKPPVKTHL